MARRPVYCVSNVAPYFVREGVEFTYNGGFALSQKQKNIAAIHAAFEGIHPEAKILEISTKSLQPLGVALSAFRLLKEVPSLGERIPVENVFQGGKRFAEDGPFLDLYGVSPREAKGDPRLRESGRLTAFCFEGECYPTEPKTAFYDWIYANALLENQSLAEALVEYDAFSDVEFNPQRSINCQAKAAAIFVSLHRLGKLDLIRSHEAFAAIYQSPNPPCLSTDR